MAGSADKASAGLVDRHRDLDPGALAVILLIGLLVRITAWLYAPHVIHSDETFQYIEQGFRLLTGRGAVPWEYLDGIRSWILPGIVSGILLAAEFIGVSIQERIFSIRIVAITFSLIPVYVTFYSIRRNHSLIAAVTGALIVTLWFEAIYFSSAILTEIIAAHILLLALHVGRRFPIGGRDREGTRCILAGALLALALSLRFHYGLGIALAGIMLAGRDIRRWRLLFWGGLGILLPMGVLDWLTLGSPFQSIYLNFVRNIIDGVASQFGREPVTYFLFNFWWMWGIAVLVLPLALIGLKQWPALAVVSVAILASHALVSHKEYRHIYFALISLAVLMGIGAAVLVDRFQRQISRVSAAAIALAVVGALSYWSGTTGLMRDRWASLRPMIEAFAEVARTPDVCGLAVINIDPWATLGYAYFVHDAPISFDHTYSSGTTRMALSQKTENRWRGRLIAPYDGGEDPDDQRPFNYVIAPEQHTQPTFERRSCFQYPPQTHLRSAICIWHRPGGCDPQ